MGRNTGSGVPTDEPVARQPIFWADTSVAAVAAPAPSGPEHQPVRVHSVAELAEEFGDVADSPLGRAVADLLGNGGKVVLALRAEDGAAALAALEQAPSFQLLVVDPALLDGRHAEAHALCERRRAFLVADALPGGAMPAGLGANAAVYHPPLLGADGTEHPAAPSVAGVYARTDAARGVWKHPAGSAAQVVGAVDVAQRLTEREMAALGTRQVNALRPMPDGSLVVWGARTAASDPDRKYVAVQRLILFLEESLHQGLPWAVQEPNDEELQATICSDVHAFLWRLWHEGAFPGTKAEEAFFVRCDATTSSPEELADGRLVCLVGVAPIRPGEFVTVRIPFATAGPPG